MKPATVSPGVMPMNQADRLSSVVPVLPAIGRPTVRNAVGPVDQPPQLPVAAPYPVTQRAASSAPRATAVETAWRQRGLTTGTPAAVVAGFPSSPVIDSTGSRSQYRPSRASVPYAAAIISGVLSAS